MGKTRILVIDDDRPIRDMIATILRIEGYEVQSASNGSQGLLALEQFLPSVILLDMMMPITNGWSFLETVRSRALAIGVPIIIVSAHESAAKTFEGHCYVAKPVQLKTLLTSIKEAITSK